MVPPLPLPNVSKMNPPIVVEALVIISEKALSPDEGITTG
jgi:hypothetical protein